MGVPGEGAPVHRTHAMRKPAALAIATVVMPLLMLNLNLEGIYFSIAWTIYGASVPL